MTRSTRALPLTCALVLLACVPGGATRSAARPTAAPSITFDSSLAFEHIRQLVAIGPRPPASPGIQQARAYITARLKAIGLSPVEQPFEPQTPFGAMKMANIIARIPGTRPERLLIAGHYDTKLFRQFRFVGANDGGSSAAMLLELGRVLKARKNALTIELVFLDGEEALLPTWSGTDNTYGSRHYLDAARQDGTLSSIKGLILLDMVGDRDLTIRRETQSTAWMTDALWGSARKLGHPEFMDEEFLVEDDHIPFLKAGIPAVDVIDLDYQAWHTANDTLDAVSARSLQIVGDVVVHALPTIEARLAR
jgi:Zn-dependent M28 family amino/carboxypeptidase